MTTETSPSKPPHVQQSLIIAALLACLLVGGGIIYWFVFAGSGGASTVKVDPSKQKPARIPRAPEMPGITRTGTERWTVRGTVGSVDIRRNDKKFDFQYNFVSGYQPSALLLAASRATRDDAMANEWGVTRDQAKQIRAEFDKNSDMELTASEVATLSAIWERYLAGTDTSSRSAAHKEMLLKLDEIVKAKLQRANEMLERNERRIREILSPESIDKMVKK